MLAGVILVERVANSLKEELDKLLSSATYFQLQLAAELRLL